MSGAALRAVCGGLRDHAAVEPVADSTEQRQDLHMNTATDGQVISKLENELVTSLDIGLMYCTYLRFVAAVCVVRAK